jgi:hypothetical protein
VVTTAASYRVAQLATLPQTTATVKVGGRQVTDTGVLLETLVTDAGPTYPASLLWASWTPGSATIPRCWRGPRTGTHRARPRAGSAR